MLNGKHVRVFVARFPFTRYVKIRERERRATTKGKEDAVESGERNKEREKSEERYERRRMS